MVISKYEIENFCKRSYIAGLTKVENDKWLNSFLKEKGCLKKDNLYTTN